MGSRRSRAALHQHIADFLDQDEPGRPPDLRRRGFAVLSVRFVCAGDRTPAGVFEGLQPSIRTTEPVQSEIRL